MLGSSSESELWTITWDSKHNWRNLRVLNMSADSFWTSTGVQAWWWVMLSIQEFSLVNYGSFFVVTAYGKPKTVSSTKDKKQYIYKINTFLFVHTVGPYVNSWKENKLCDMITQGNHLSRKTDFGCITQRSKYVRPIYQNKWFMEVNVV